MNFKRRTNYSPEHLTGRWAYPPGEAPSSCGCLVPVRRLQRCHVDVKREFDQLIEDDEMEGTAAAILVLAAAVGNVAFQLEQLGNGGAATPMGALEALGKVHKEGLEEIAVAVSDLMQK